MTDRHSGRPFMAIASHGLASDAPSSPRIGRAIGCEESGFGGTLLIVQIPIANAIAQIRRKKPEADVVKSSAHPLSRCEKARRRGARSAATVDHRSTGGSPTRQDQSRPVRDPAARFEVAVASRVDTIRKNSGAR